MPKIRPESLKLLQKLALADLAMLSLSFMETLCPKSLTDSLQWMITSSILSVFCEFLHCLPLNKSIAS